MSAAISGNNQPFRLREFFQKRQTSLRAEHKHYSCQSITEGDAVGDNGDALAISGRHAGLRIEDMVVTYAIFFEKALIVSRSNHGPIADLYRFKDALLFTGVLDSDAP